MRRTASILTCCALILLLGVAEAIAAAAGPPPNTKSTGPAVSGTIVIGQPGSSTGGMFAIRLVKGTLQSGALVFSVRALSFSTGCDTSSTAIENHFLGGPSIPGGLLSVYFTNTNVLIEIFTELGITIGANGVITFEPIITDVANAVCSPSNSTGALSLSVTIQFAVPTK